MCREGHQRRATSVLQKLIQLTWASHRALRIFLLGKVSPSCSKLGALLAAMQWGLAPHTANARACQFAWSGPVLLVLETEARLTASRR